MRYVFKTRYNQDIRIWRHEGDLGWYAALLLGAVLMPLALPAYYIGELSTMLIWAIGGLGAMLLVGYTGQISLGQAAFVGIGAYTQAVLISMGFPFLVALPVAGTLAAATGLLVGAPLTRLHGIYLAVGTLAFASVVEQIFANWDSVTHGLNGMPVGDATIGSFSIGTEPAFYYVCLLIAIVATLGVLNWLRSPTGRAMVAIRDSEIAAVSMGVNLVAYKSYAFAASAFLSGVMGALLAHKISYLAPEVFNVNMSIQLLMLVLVGGIGSLRGVYFGAAFVALLPLLIGVFRQALPEWLARQPGLEPGFYGAILVIFILFEPAGIEGRWQKIKFFFSSFPLYKAATFKRQKLFTRSERLR